MFRGISKNLNSYRSEIIVTLLFLIIYSLISLVNHYNFRTYALDLGMFNQALYSFSNGNINHFTLDLSGHTPNYFADHFSPLTLLYTPLYYLFGSWTLLLIQIASIIFGAFGCYRIARIKLPDFKHHFVILIFFLAQWAIISALAFDFHNNVVAAMFVPWFIYFRMKGKNILSLFMFTLILIAKENMALWMFFILFGMMLSEGFRSLKTNFYKYLRFEIPLMLVSILYFYIVVSMVMPSLSNGEAVNQIARFGRLGSSIPEIVIYVFSHPIETFKLLFASQLEDPASYGIKTELHLVVLFSGGFALLVRPAYLLMLIPIYAQKLFSDNMVIWGINGQYSIEFTPIIALALIDLLAKIKTTKNQFILLTTATVLAAGTNFKTLKSRDSVWYDATNYDPFNGSHYSSGGLDVKYIHNELGKIPDDIPVSVSSCIAPHLERREGLYHFPIIHDAELIVLFKSLRSTYPVTIEDQQRMIKELTESGQFKLIHDKKDLIILEKQNKKTFETLKGHETISNS